MKGTKFRYFCYREPEWLGPPPAPGFPLHPPFFSDTLNLKSWLRSGLAFNLRELYMFYYCFSKMIIQEELTASMDEPNECVVMHRVEPTKMQALSVQFAEKLCSLADNNEQIIDPRSGTFIIGNFED